MSRESGLFLTILLAMPIVLLLSAIIRNLWGETPLTGTLLFIQAFGVTRFCQFLFEKSWPDNEKTNTF